MYWPEDADIVARRHAPVGAADPLEHCRWIDIVGRLGILAEGIILGEIVHPKTVDVDMLSGIDGLCGEADDLVVAPDRLSHAMRAEAQMPSATGAPGIKVVRAITTPSSGCRRSVVLILSFL
jgi:hypothetical protein